MNRPVTTPTISTVAELSPLSSPVSSVSVSVPRILMACPVSGSATPTSAPTSSSPAVSCVRISRSRPRSPATTIHTTRETTPMASTTTRGGTDPAGQVPSLQPVDQRDEDGRQDGREDQRDQQVADEPEQEERDRGKDRDAHRQPCATTEGLQPVRQARRPVDGWRLTTHAPLLHLGVDALPRPMVDAPQTPPPHPQRMIGGESSLDVHLLWVMAAHPTVHDPRRRKARGGCRKSSEGCR
jgi:hypothetical protein